MGMIPLDKINNRTPETRARSGTILIVEDETLVGWSLANALKKVGHNVAIVPTGEAAIEYLTECRCGLLITDVNLPHMDGFQVAAIAKARFPSLPVIMTSALDDEKARSRAAQAHIDYFIEKPFNLNEMTALVNAILAKEPDHQV